MPSALFDVSAAPFFCSRDKRVKLGRDCGAGACPKRLRFHLIYAFYLWHLMARQD